MTLGWISFFGLLGVLARYAVDSFIPTPSVGAFPFSTLLVNIAGSFLVGILSCSPRSDLQIGLIVGFCGGFTTFSAYSLQVFQMIQSQRLLTAALYLSLTPLTGVLGAYLGSRLGKGIIGVC